MRRAHQLSINSRPTWQFRTILSHWPMNRFSMDVRRKWTNLINFSTIRGPKLGRRTSGWMGRIWRLIKELGLKSLTEGFYTLIWVQTMSHYPPARICRIRPFAAWVAQILPHRAIIIPTTRPNKHPYDRALEASTRLQTINRKIWFKWLNKRLSVKENII